jgi:hypothetical protein
MDMAAISKCNPKVEDSVDSSFVMYKFAGIKERKNPAIEKLKKNRNRSSS